MYTIIWSFIILDVIILFDIVVYCGIILLFIVFFPSQCIVLYFIIFYYIFIFVFYLCTQPISTIHYIVHVQICLYLQVLSSLTAICSLTMSSFQDLVWSLWSATLHLFHAPGGCNGFTPRGDLLVGADHFDLGALTEKRWEKSWKAGTMAE